MLIPTKTELNRSARSLADDWKVHITYSQALKKPLYCATAACLAYLGNHNNGTA
jgi:hypothetical protein